MFSDLNLFGPDKVFFESSELTKLSPRSLLYPLIPFRVGQSDCESLDSYFGRLADAHCVSPGLLFLELSPLLGQCSSTWYQPGAFTRTGICGLNGFGKMSKAWVTILSRATGIPALHYCGLSVLEDLFSCHRLFDNRNRYCPCCLNQAKTYKHYYRRLLWTLKDVNACPVHRVALIEQNCAASQEDFLRRDRRKVLFGVCSKCGALAYGCTCTDIAPASENDLWCASEVADLLHLLPEAGQRFSRTRLRHGVKLIADMLNNDSPFSKLNMGHTSYTTLYTWLRGEGKLSFSIVLNLCRAANVSLPSVLAGKPQTSHLASTYVSSRVSRWRALPSYEERQCAVENALDPNNLPESMASVARKLGVDRSSLARQFPMQAAMIVHRYAVFQKSELEQKHRAQMHVFDTAVHSLEKRGEMVTRKKVEAQIGFAILPASFLATYAQERLGNFFFNRSPN